FWYWRWRRRHRSRFTGAAGIVGFLAGIYLAGRAMMGMGWFKPGETPNAVILGYWPGFLAGGAILGGLAAFAAHWFRTNVVDSEEG
ncbi:MAG TPA: hypothetical protein VNC50_16585, partial [Planctomycetia bacterium]|nr:hypothetical protein [Planctomycetia bacterium]